MFEEHMSKPNAYGLTRPPSAPVCKAIREKCGFGCVVCGSAIVDYEHFNPEFKDAKSHDVDGMILLCPNHHRSKGAFISRSTIAQAAAAPYCKQNGFAWVPLDLSNTTTLIGPFIVLNCSVVLELEGEPVIWFNPPEEQGGPNRLNLILRDEAGADLVRIVDNVWSASPEARDVKLTSGDAGGRLEVHDEYGPVFKAQVYPPHSVEIEVFRSWKNGHHYAIGRDKSGKAVVSKDGDLIMAYGSDNLVSSGCFAAASIR